MNKLIVRVFFVALLFWGSDLKAENHQIIDSLQKRIAFLSEAKPLDSFQLWLAYYHSFDELAKIGRKDDSQNAFLKSLEVAPNDTFKYRSYYRRSVWFSEIHEGEEAIRLASEIIKKFPGYHEALASGYMFMAVAHEHNKEFDQALSYYEKSLKESIISGDSGSYFMVKMNMANTLFDLGKKEEAIDYYKQGIRYYGASDNPGFKFKIASLYNNIGTSYMGHNSDSAIKFLKLSKALSIEIGDEFEMGLSSLNLGIEYFTVGKPLLAKAELMQSLKNMNLINETYYHYDIYRMLGAIESYNQNWTAAMNMMDSSKYFHERGSNAMRAEAFAEAKAQSRIGEESLKNDQLLASNRAAHEKLQWQRIATFSLVGLLLLLAAFMLFRYRQYKTIKSLITEKDNLMGILFHDLRSPMAAIKTVSDMIGEDQKVNLDPHSRELLHEMSKVSAYGLNLVDTLFYIYELENKQLQIKKSEIEIAEIFGIIESEFTSLAKTKGIELEMPKTELKVTSHREFLISILRNLVSNGIKFSSSAQKVELELKDNMKHTIIIVRDNGPGFSTVDQNNMFKKFTTLTAKPTNGEKSTGLGLYLVSLMAKKINATITLNSTYTQGAEFHLIIPKQNG